ncbi:hypothetical protein BBJ28_00009843 [Nothophytophthora sp. Chile5]|nr:hypothetical protein BBJ28_00009843 [Nothophytophthora sp. Chile5]
MASRRQRQMVDEDAAVMESGDVDRLEMEELRAQDGDDDDDDDATGAGKRRLFRFKPRFDVVLVREVIRWFPWAAGYGRTRSAWVAVATSVQAQLEATMSVSFNKGNALDHAIVKRRVDMLLDAYRKNEMAGLRGAGSPADFDLRNKLLAILSRVVDEQTVNKGAMREKRVQQALQVAVRSLAELGDNGAVPSVELTSGGAPASLTSIAPAPTVGAGATAASAAAPAIARAAVGQQNGSGVKRGPRAGTVAAAASAKRPRTEKLTEPTLAAEERKLRLEERRVALEEERLAWEKQKAAQEAQERQSFVDVLRAQGSLVAELLTQLRTRLPQ